MTELALRDPIELPDGCEYAVMVAGPADGRRFVVYRDQYNWRVPGPARLVTYAIENPDLLALRPTPVAVYARRGRRDDGIAWFAYTGTY